MNCRRVIYFHNGSIGDFLLTMHFMEHIQDISPDMKLIIVVPRNLAVCQEIAKGYPYVELVESSHATVVLSLSQYMIGGNCVILPPTPGTIPVLSKLNAKLLTIFPKERLIGFSDSGVLAQYLYDEVLVYDATKPYHESMHDLVHAISGITPKDTPTLSFERDPTVYEHFGVEPHEYVVFHPFGSDKKRSIPQAELPRVVEALQEKIKKKIILSGSSDDIERVSDILKTKSKSASLIFADSEISFAKRATLIQDASHYVGVDTGISHTAALLETPSTIVAHPGSSIAWLPYYNPKATILYRLLGEQTSSTDRAYLQKNCPSGLFCFDSVPTDAVIEALPVYD